MPTKYIYASFKDLRTKKKTISLHRIKELVVITETENVHWAIRTESFNIIQLHFCLQVVPWFRKLVAGLSLRGWCSIPDQSKRSFPSRRCLHFVVVGGLEWSKDPGSYADGNLATGRASLAGQFDGDDPD
jgi:hypothetical protein